MFRITKTTMPTSDENPVVPKRGQGETKKAAAQKPRNALIDITNSLGDLKALVRSSSQRLLSGDSEKPQEKKSGR
jgi:hypothetical protein